jgi:hypothetical protein
VVLSRLQQPAKNTGITGFVSGPGPDGGYLTGDEPIQYAQTGLYQWSMKYSYQLSQNNRVNYVWQQGTKFVGRQGRATAPLEGTTDYTNPCAINRVSFSTLNSWSLFNVVGATWAGGPTTAPSASRRIWFEFSQPRFDRETQLNTGNSPKNTGCGRRTAG